MAAAILVIVLVLFFLVLFALFAHKSFSSVHASQLHRPPPPPPRVSWRLSYYSPPARSFGLDPAVLCTMPVRSYHSSTGEGCVVCLQEFEEGEKVKVVAGCGHVFHPDCIDGWLVLHGSCPICRCSKVFLDDQDKEEEEEEEEMVEVVVVVEEGGEEERKVVGLGRSRSLCWRRDDEEEGRGRSSLRRVSSV